MKLNARYYAKHVHTNKKYNKYAQSACIKIKKKLAGGRKLTKIKNALPAGICFGIFIIAALVTWQSHSFRAQQNNAYPHHLEVEFATCCVVEKCTVSARVAVGAAAGKSEKHLEVLLRVLHNIMRGRTDRKIIIQMIIIISGVELNPGPKKHCPTKRCPMCDHSGRKNSVWVTCTQCNESKHAQCLKLTQKERSTFRVKGYICWACSLPPAALSDSFLSLPPPLALSESFESEINDNATNKNSPSISAINTRSLNNQKTKADLVAWIQMHSTDIIAMNETWLKEDVGDHEVIPRSYIVFRKDRKKRKKNKKGKETKRGGIGGGVLLAIKPHLQPRRAEELEVPNIEIMWATVKMDKMHLLIGSAYRAPDLDAAQNKQFLDALDLAVNKMHNYDGIILMGDFNLDVDWAGETPRAGLDRPSEARKFLSRFADAGLTQLIKGHTRTTNKGGKTLDLLLTDVPEIFSAASVVAGISDHDALLANLNLNVVRPMRPPKTIFNFGRANWDKLEEEFARSLPQEYPDMEINAAWEQWKKTFFDCLNKHVPTKKVKGKDKMLPWLTKCIRKLILKKDKLFTQWFKNKTAAARELYVKARREAQHALRRAKDEFMWKLGTGPQGSKFFWSYIKERSKVPMNNTAFTDEGKSISQPQEVASLFSQSFQKNFSQVVGIFPFMRRNSPTATETQPTCLNEIKISTGEAKNLLDSIKQNSATGPDKIPAIVLKKCSSALSKSLSALFTLSLETGTLAHEWKTANVTPIHKDGDKSDVKNYRPISVTSQIGKVLEKHIRNKTVEYLTREKIIPDNQHGFRNGRSCTTMLTKTIESWTAAMDKKSGTHIHAVFLDWSKAFDKVPHERLLSKLEHYGIKGKLHGWFKSFLTGRTQQVVYGGSQSEPTNVLSGVIQGSVLGPLLFNIFVADLPNCVRNSDLKQYADDCSLSKEIKSQTDEKELQDDLDNVSLWCVNNGMELNAKKCKVMDITHARNVRHTTYTIGGTQLQYVETERLLGIHISKNLKWNYHSDVTSKKAAQILGFTQRNLKGCTPRVKRTAYLTLVKPILFYGTPAWHPETKRNIGKMVRLQRRSLRFIYGSHLPPVDQQKMMPVEMQLRYNDLVFFKKCETGDIDCNVKENLIVRRTLRSNGGENSAHPKLQPRVPTRAGFAQNDFVHRVIAPWNDLPDPLKDCSAQQFPALCKAYLWQNFNVFTVSENDDIDDDEQTDSQLV
jgi:hypothetical protein